jgi:hypothetical protein
MENLTVENLKTEGTIKDESALWLKSKINAQPSRLYLTNKRIAYRKDANPFAGLLLKLFVKSARANIIFNIELKEIQNISKASFGANKTVLAIKYGNNLEVKFWVNDYNSWETELKKLNV